MGMLDLIWKVVELLEKVVELLQSKKKTMSI